MRRLGFGAMRITGRGIMGEPADRDAAKRLLRRALDLGVNFIDTADSYGPRVSERLIAEALYPYPDELVIATKAGFLRPAAFEWTLDGRPEHLRAACEESLTILRMEAIPLFQFHRPDPKVPLEESIGALVDLQQEGKIRHIGVSNVDEEQLARARQVATIVSVQNRYNPFDRSSDALVDVCARDGLAFIPWAPLGADDCSDGALTEIAARRGVTRQQAVLAWLLARSRVMLPIPGTSSLEHLEENVAAASLALSSEEIAGIDALAAGGG